MAQPLTNRLTLQFHRHDVHVAGFNDIATRLTLVSACHNSLNLSIKSLNPTLKFPQETWSYSLGRHLPTHFHWVHERFQKSKWWPRFPLRWKQPQEEQQLTACVLHPLPTFSPRPLGLDLFLARWRWRAKNCHEKSGRRWSLHWRPTFRPVKGGCGRKCAGKSPMILLGWWNLIDSRVSLGCHPSFLAEISGFSLQGLIPVCVQFS